MGDLTGMKPWPAESGFEIEKNRRLEAWGFLDLRCITCDETIMITGAAKENTLGETVEKFKDIHRAACLGITGGEGAHPDWIFTGDFEGEQRRRAALKVRLDARRREPGYG